MSKQQDEKQTSAPEVPDNKAAESGHQQEVAHQDELKCVACGHTIEQDDLECPNCGISLVAG